MKFTAIDIDFDIYKLIENERRGFEELPFVALRRLLKMPEPDKKENQQSATAEDGRPWRMGRVEIPHGSLARMEYDRGRQIYEGQFLNGKLVVNGHEFPTLSSAARALAKTKNGQPPNLNGWNYWQARFPGETEWRSLDEMRQRRF
ncbi:hypothetical protein [uncultured Sphingomonas sp.]|uniref:hypothetical protein n=1 Tax=uncultured Sphingomonas sp. TaxID=158754 RepID=UPI0035CB60F5